MADGDTGRDDGKAGGAGKGDARPGKSDAELKARMDALSDRLQRAGAPETADGDRPADGAMGQAMGQGMRAMGEFVGAVGVSALIGWQIDEWLNTTPFLLLIFLALGTVAGFWNVYRIAARPTSGPRSGSR